MVIEVQNTVINFFAATDGETLETRTKKRQYNGHFRTVFDANHIPHLSKKLKHLSANRALFEVGIGIDIVDDTHLQTVSM